MAIRENGDSGTSRSMDLGSQELPAFPMVVSKLLEVANGEGASAVGLERLLGSDQALVAMTLRMVNSTYYGLPRRIESLNEAVALLGVQQIRKLAMSFAAKCEFSSRTPRQRKLQRQLWQHSVASACAGLTLARKLRLPASEQELAFVAGLMHDVGRLCLFSQHPEAYVEVDYELRNGKCLFELESRRFGTTHVRTGRELAESWRIPPRLVAMIGGPGLSFERGSDPLGAVVHIAHNIADQIVVGPSAIEDLDHGAVEWLQSLDEEMFQIKNEVEAKVCAYERMYGMAAA